MKRIVVINQDSGYLVIDIINALCKEQHSVSLLTGRLVCRNNKPDESVEVRKIIKYNRSNTVSRLYTWTIAFFQILRLVKTRYRHDNLFIVSNPPFATFIPLFCRNSFSLMIFDVYPDALTEIKLIKKNSLFVKMWQRINRKVFARADNIFTLSEGMALSLRKYTVEEKIKVVSVWSDNDFFKPIAKEANPFVADNGLMDRFVVLYSGNLGATHNIQVIPALAGEVKNPRVLFLIIGNGDRRNWIEEEISTRGLNNCRLMDLLPVEQIPYSFASADLAIVSLGKNASNLSLPSKTFNFMSAGIPLLCIAGVDSGLDHLVSGYDTGRCFDPEQYKEIALFIDEMAANEELLEQYKTNARMASLNFTPENAALIADMVIKSL